MLRPIPRHWKQDDRPARGAWAPGDYLFNCSKCECQAFGAKGARYCADCAYADEPKAASPICLDCGADTSFQDHADHCSENR